MARNGSDDAIRRGTTGVEQVEGLLAYAATQSRRAALKSAREAVALSRNVSNPLLLARALRTAATLLLPRRPAEALPLAQEAVSLCQPCGGAPLVVSLTCLANTLNALHRYGEAAEVMAAAEKLARQDP